MEEKQVERRFIRLKEVKKICGLSRTTLYQKIKKGEFPESYALGVRAIGWLASDVDAWIASRVKVGAAR